MKAPLFLLLSTALLRAELVDVVLTLSPPTTSENSIELQITAPLASAPDQSEVSGTVNARIDIDPTTGEISSLELLSGNISGTPVSFSATSFLASYNVATSALGGTVDTPNAPAPVTAGQSAADLHEFTINSGTLTGSARLGPTNTPVSQNFAAPNNVTGTGAPGSFVEIDATANSGLSTTTTAVYDLTFLYPLEITQSVEAGVNITIEAEGNLVATGQVSLTLPITDPYLLWATANGIAEADFTAFDFNSQLPNGLLWALGFQGDDSPTILSPTSDGAFTLVLPTAGTASEVVVLTSTDLSSGSFAPLPSGQLAGADNPIPQGTIGTLTITPNGSGPRFYRLSASPPSL